MTDRRTPNPDFPIRELVQAIRVGRVRLVVEIVELRGRLFVELGVRSIERVRGQRDSRERVRLPIERYKAIEGAVAHLRGAVRRKLSQQKTPPTPSKKSGT